MNERIEVLIGTKPESIQEQSKELKEFIARIQEKYPDWEEFVLSNHKDKSLRILKLSNEIITLGRGNLGRLIQYLDRYNNNWIRLGISKKRSFPFVRQAELKIGMLVRLDSSNTNPYHLITKMNENSFCTFQEGNMGKKNNEDVEYELTNLTKYNYCLLCESLVNEDEYRSTDWPESKGKK